ncbi:Histidine kinase [anaerobic digester metagenome]
MKKPWRSIIRSLTLLIPGLLICFTAGAQLLYKTEITNYDSLELVLPALKGVQKADVLLKLSAFYTTTDSVKCLDYARQAHRIAEKAKDKRSLCKGKLALANAFYFRGDYLNALIYGLDALELAGKPDDLQLRFEAITQVWLIYFYSGNPDLANKVAREAIPAFEGVKDPEARFRFFISGGWALMISGSGDLALPLFHQCAAIYHQSNKIPLPNYIVLIYQTGYAHLGLNQIDSALFYFRKGNGILNDNPGIFKKLPSFVADFNDDIAQCYLKMNLPDSAEKYVLYSIEQFRQRGERDILEVGQNCLDMGTILTEKSAVEEAFPYLEKAMDCGNWIYEHKKVALDDAGSRDYWYNPLQNNPLYNEQIGLRISIMALDYMCRIQKELGNHEQALALLEEFNRKSKLMETILKQQSIISLNTRYQTERKEEQLQILSQQHQLNEAKLERTRMLLFTFLAITLLAIIIVSLLIRQYRIRQQQQSNLLMQKLFRAQLNPHFIFNTLSNIQGMILEHATVEASTYLSQLSKLMRNILYGSMKEYISLNQEIENIENYVRLQILRYRDRFSYEMSVDEALDTPALLIPPMLVQPFVENAIEHGLRFKEEKGNLKVEIRLSGSFIEFLITDDGIGRAKAAELERERQKYRISFATQTIQQRIASLNRLSRRKYSLDIDDLTDTGGSPAGTKVRITMPVNPV